VREDISIPMSTPLVFDSESLAFSAAAELFGNAVQEFVGQKGSCVVVVAGGRSTSEVLRITFDRHIDWEKVHFVMADERCVPQMHPDRNDGLLKRIIESANLQNAPTVHSIDAELSTSEGLSNFESLLGKIGSPDIALVGIADDGHLASLFPNSKSLSALQNAVFVDDSPKPPKHRISCSMAYLTRATYRIALQTGHNKRDIFVRLQQGERLPLALFSPTHWFMDYAAAH
jgi:6-phosphogluconolactonase